MLKWNVIIEDINKREITKYNVFNHGRFREDLYNMMKDKQKAEKEGKIFNVDEYLSRICMYYFWSKCEWEIIVTSWPPHLEYEKYLKLQDEVREYESKYECLPRVVDAPLDIAEKIDVYDQLKMNWELFKDYILRNQKEILKEFKPKSN